MERSGYATRNEFVDGSRGASAPWPLRTASDFQGLAQRPERLVGLTNRQGSVAQIIHYRRDATGILRLGSRQFAGHFNSADDAAANDAGDRVLCGERLRQTRHHRHGSAPAWCNNAAGASRFECTLSLYQQLVAEYAAEGANGVANPGSKRSWYWNQESCFRIDAEVRGSLEADILQ